MKAGLIGRHEMRSAASKEPIRIVKLLLPKHRPFGSPVQTSLLESHSSKSQSVGENLICSPT